MQTAPTYQPYELIEDDLGYLEVKPLVEWSQISTGAGYLQRKYKPQEHAIAVTDQVWLDPDLRALEWELCRRDVWRWLTSWCWTFDKMDSVRPVKRFPRYDYLRELTEAHQARIDGTTDKRHILVIKPRTSLFSIKLALWKLHGLMFRDFYSAFMMSIKFGRVDDGGVRSSPNSLMGKIRFTYNMLPQWQQALAPLEFTEGKVRNRLTGAMVHAEVAGGDTGVGLQVDEGDIDEAGLIANLEEILAIAEPGCRALSVGGTPRAAGSGFHFKAEQPSEAYRKFELDWHMNPDRRMCVVCKSFEYAEDGAKMLDRETGEEVSVMIQHKTQFCSPKDGTYYDDVRGRWTSPWFKNATKDWSEELIRREFERDFYRAVEGKVYRMLRRNIHVVELNAPTGEDGLTVGTFLDRAEQRDEWWDHGFSDSTAIFQTIWDGKTLWFREYYERNGETADFYCRRKAWLCGEFWLRDEKGNLTKCWLPDEVRRQYEGLWGPPNRHYGKKIKYYGDPAGAGVEGSTGMSWHRSLGKGVKMRDKAGNEHLVGRIFFYKWPLCLVDEKIEACKLAIERGIVRWVRDPQLRSFQSDAETGYNRVESYHRRVDSQGLPKAEARPVHDISSHAADSFGGAVTKRFGIRRHPLTT